MRKGRTQLWRAPEKIFVWAPSCPATVCRHGPFKETCGRVPIKLTRRPVLLEIGVATAVSRRDLILLLPSPSSQIVHKAIYNFMPSNVRGADIPLAFKQIDQMAETHEEYRTHYFVFKLKNYGFNFNACLSMFRRRGAGAPEPSLVYAHAIE
ncbi:hypothetical protein J6590_058581 [Homalodisca vitripennis]|nr:hypothetical protein J6590_058581 [Homalodisca vitripennis]